MVISSALITGGASGIGRQLVEQLASTGYSLTVVDLAAEALLELDAYGKAQGWKLFVVCADVSDDEAVASAFQQHVQRYGSLDVVVLNAGIGERGDFLDSPPGSQSWQKTLDVDLRAVLVGMRLAGQHMRRAGRGGRILSVASAAGIFPVPAGPVYAAAKAGVIHATRSLAPRLAPHGIQVATVCPQYVDTPLVQNMLRNAPEVAKAMMGALYRAPLLRPQQVVDLILQLLRQPLPVKGRQVPYAEEMAGAGCVHVLLQNGKVWDPFAVTPKSKSGGGSSGGSSSGSSSDGGGSSSSHAVTRYSPAALRTYAEATAAALPRKYRKVQVVRLSSSFREATKVVEVEMPRVEGLAPGHVLVRRLFVGVNASDINYTSGRYHGSTAAAEKALPYDAGFESVGVVVAVAPSDTSSSSSSSSSTALRVGQAVATMEAGFSDYGVVATRRVLPVSSPTPEVLALMTSGLTASIALEEVGRLTIPGANGSTASGSIGVPRKVLVTAAAGGTGQFAVQLAKLAGCYVVGTCGGPEKAALLRRLGVDRVIDYRSENVKQVLKTEFPQGMDLIYESVGGDMFDLCVDALAPKGTLIVIGMMSAYAEGWKKSRHEGLAEKLLWKSAGVAGFFLLKYAPLWGSHLQRLTALVAAGQLQVAIDRSRCFVGLEDVPDAVDWLQSGRSNGKVVVQLARELPAVAAGGGAGRKAAVASRL